MRRLCALLLATALGGLAACGSSAKAYVPVDSALRPWEAPEVAEPEPEAAPVEEPAAAPASPTK